MKKLFKSREEAETISKALTDLGYWTDIKCKRLPDDSGWYSYIEIFGYDN